MAALRFAARRLVGGRTPAAVEEAQRRLLPRLFHEPTRSTSSTAANTNVPKGLAGDEHERRLKLLAEIHYRGEELYDMISEANNIYNIPGRLGREMRLLRQDLSIQIDPRPNDSKWRALRKIKNFEHYGGFAATIFSGYVLFSMLTGSIVRLNPEEKEWIREKRIKQPRGVKSISFLREKQ
ncbi:uncharacterized protein LOC100824495 [Brachypodium distachyon]|uniref:Uncharacterized protein n=1 Tax=Brachypodium distachyon TaxID=15368 RepID=I1HFZ6_BRADI|nr:uncharacterized protein LOC100824495 [Brachypodium distachyon]KQK04668.1 hypothetical protein BRADI_2g15057v3 [Brachypodium distachyon]|eukprot:XP_003567818.1 uncharacterized protein LOC100824495 [Brachypodium distachyon]